MRRNLIVGRQLEPDDKRSAFGRIARQDRQLSALRQAGRRRLPFDVARPNQQNHFVLCKSWHCSAGQQSKRYNYHTHFLYLPYLFGLDAAFTIPDVFDLIERILHAARSRACPLHSQVSTHSGGQTEAVTVRHASQATTACSSRAVPDQIYWRERHSMFSGRTSPSFYKVEVPRYIRPQSHKVWLLCQLQRRNASEGFAKQDHRCS